MRTEGGHKRGHSNMEHWDHTEDIKDATRKNRRSEDITAITASLTDDMVDIAEQWDGDYLCPLCDNEHSGMCDDAFHVAEEVIEFYQEFTPWCVQNMTMSEAEWQEGLDYEI